MINYLINKVLFADMLKENNLNFITINGFIYRGDEHTYLMETNKPKYFGSFETSALYVDNKEYIKKFKTLHTLKILDLTNTKNNINKINSFFKNDLLNLLIIKYEYLPESYLKFIIKITHLFLQIFNGIIINNYYNIDLLGLSIKNIIKYLKKYEFNEIDIQFIIKLLTTYKKNKKILPSRVGITKFDNLIIKNLKFLLEPLGINGVFYIETKKTEESLCNILDKDFKLVSCVPSDILLFNPKKDVKITNIYQKIDNKFHEVEIK